MSEKQIGLKRIVSIFVLVALFFIIMQPFGMLFLMNKPHMHPYHGHPHPDKHCQVCIQIVDIVNNAKKSTVNIGNSFIWLICCVFFICAIASIEKNDRVAQTLIRLKVELLN